MNKFKIGDRVRLNDPGMCAYLGHYETAAKGVVIECFSQSAVVLWEGATWANPFDGRSLPANLCLTVLCEDLELVP